MNSNLVHLLVIGHLLIFGPCKLQLQIDPNFHTNGLDVTLITSWFWVGLNLVLHNLEKLGEVITELST